jgi:hypothetical protein
MDGLCSSDSSPVRRSLVRLTASAVGSRFFWFALLMVALLSLFFGVISPVGATPVDFTGALAPAVTGEDVVATGFNFLAAFSILVLASMGLRFGPRIKSAMMRMM